MSLARPKILISGSGIAGSVFANCLLRAYKNADITIVERDPTLRLTGQSVDVRSNAVDVIKWMGVEPEIRKNGTQEQGVQMIGLNEKPIATFAATGRTDVQSMTSEYEIFRGALARIFIEPVMPHVKLVLGETVASYEQRPDAVKVSFSNGKATEDYDLLVAADGVGSRIRGWMLDAKPREQIVDHGLHAAYFTVNKDLLQGSKFGQWYSAPGRRGIFLRPDPTPNQTRANMVICTTDDPESLVRRHRLDAAMKEGHEAYMTLLEEEFKDVAWLRPEILRLMRESPDFYCSLFTRVKSPKYHDGRVVLLGDAGYATPGIGTSFAILGGYALAGEILRHGPDKIPEAAQAYAELMRPFVSKEQDSFIGKAMEYMNPETRLGVGIKNTVLGLITALRIDKIGMSLSAAVGWTEKKLPLPDYPWPAAA